MMRLLQRTLFSAIALFCILVTVCAFSSSSSRSIHSGYSSWRPPCTAISFLLRLSTSPSSGTEGPDQISSDVAQYYKEQADQLRNEIAAFEQEKTTLQQIEAQKLQEEQEAATLLRDRYSAVVPILKPDGSVLLEPCRFTPIHTDGTSYITTMESALPLGILIGEAVTTMVYSDGQSKSRSYIVIDEISANSCGAQCGLLVGDIIHACTACKIDMEMPTWQLLLGGIGRPKTNRYMHSVGGASNLLENTMEAIASNRMDPEERPVLLVIERRSDPGRSLQVE